jgi:hypothetical protein
MRVEIAGFRPFVGQHCETVATGSLLGAAGISLSEPMLFGLGEGLGFIFINLSTLPLPFVGGRTRPFAITDALCANLGIECHSIETSSKPKAWAALEKPLREGRPVGLQLDCFYLEYFSQPVHFAGHFVAAYGFDEREVWLVDTAPQGSTQRASRVAVEKARFAKGPMAARARAWTLTSGRKKPDLSTAARNAIRANAAEYLAPGFKGASYLGIRKLAASLPQWLTLAKRPPEDLALAALLMERAGTGGALFRNFYRDFLRETLDVLGRKPALTEAQALFAAAAAEWARVATLIEASARTGESAHLDTAAAACLTIADLEVQAMKKLARL